MELSLRPKGEDFAWRERGETARQARDRIAREREETKRRLGI